MFWRSIGDLDPLSVHFSVLYDGAVPVPSNASILRFVNQAAGGRLTFARGE